MTRPAKPIPFTQAEIRELLSYNPWTGEFYRLSPKTYKSNPRISNSAGAGYLYAIIKDKHYYLHRLAFLWMEGIVPDFVDHIDGNPKNNAWRNLRSCSLSENMGNSRKQKNNVCGFKGVSKNTKNTYCAQLAGKYIGNFSSPEEAYDAYCKAAIERWGEYAKLT